VNCEYVIAVYGYHNCTYTLLLSEHKASIVRLVPNRPQTYQLSSGDFQYFAVMVPATTDDVTITFTALNAGGYADLYAEIYNATEFNSPGAGDRIQMPDPSDPMSYSYSTELVEDTHIFLEGPVEDDEIIVVTMAAITDIKFVIIAATNSELVILQPGIPQNHYVEAGDTQYFKIHPETDDDLRVTITARTGDPDMFLSVRYANPHCEIVGDSQWEIACSNYTWSSRMFSTDQVIISRDAPCVSMISTTYVAASCDPNIDFITGPNTPVYVGVYGYKSSKFTIAAASTGKHLNLLAGQPQISSTSVGIICSTRSAETGVCVPGASYTKATQIAYFSFQVSHMTNAEDKINELMLTVIPTCNASQMIYHNKSTTPGYQPLDPNCPPGCPCNPLKVFITSCPRSSCTEKDKRPSEIYGQYKANFLVTAVTGSTMVISNLNPLSYKAWCDPDAARDDCMFYIAVSHSGSKDVSAEFSIAVRTPGDIALIPCAAKDYPDGIKYSEVVDLTPLSTKYSSKPTRSERLYEVCSQSDNFYARRRQLSSLPAPAALVPAPAPAAARELGLESFSHVIPSLSASNSDELLLQLEQCAGNATIYVCADDNKCQALLPSSSSWAFMADSKVSCSHNFNSKSSFYRDACFRQMYSGVSLLKLPAIVGNYFLSIQGFGRYQLQIHTTRKGIDLSPRLLFSGSSTSLPSPSTGDIVNDATDPANFPSIVKITGNTIALRWKQARVLFPGIRSLLVADKLSYQSFLIETEQLEKMRTENPFLHLRGHCGLEFIQNVLDQPLRRHEQEALTITNIPLLPAERGLEFMTHKLQGLKTNTRYTLILFASCDGNCFKQLTKTLASDASQKDMLISCGNSDVECKEQFLVYPFLQFTTSNKKDPTVPDSTDDGDSSEQAAEASSFVTIGMILLVVIVVVMVAVGYYWHKYNRDFFGASFNAVDCSWASLSGWFSSLSFSSLPSFSSSSSSSTSSPSVNRRGGGTEMVDRHRRGGNNSSAPRGLSYYDEGPDSGYSPPPASHNYSGGGSSSHGMLSADSLREQASNAGQGLQKVWTKISSTAKDLTKKASSAAASAASSSSSSSSAANPLHNHSKYRAVPAGSQHGPSGGNNNRSTFVVEDEDEDETLEVSL
jgi:hypothetical protein